MEIVEHLLALGVDINVGDHREGRTALCDAASGGQLAVVALLLTRGVKLDVSESVRNPLFACIVGYGGQRDEPRERFAAIADLLIAAGLDLTACYVQRSMVDMDAAAFATMWGRTDIADAVITALYGHDERMVAGAHAEALEVAVGNAFSRERFRKWRYPSKRADPATLPPCHHPASTGAERGPPGGQLAGRRPGRYRRVICPWNVNDHAVADETGCVGRSHRRAARGACTPKTRWRPSAPESVPCL